MFSHAWSLPPDPGAVPVGSEFDWQSRQSDFLPLGATDARDKHVQQPTRRQQVRISEKVAGLTDRSPGNIRPLATRFDVSLRDLYQDVLQGGNQPGTLLQPREIGGEAWVGRQFLEREFLNEACPLLIGSHTDEELAPARGFEHLINCPCATTGGHGPSFEAGGGHAGHVGAHEEGSTLEQGAADALTLAGMITFPKC